VAKKVPEARLLATAAFWVQIQTTLKNTKWANISNGVANTLQPAKKIYPVYLLSGWIQQRLQYQTKFALCGALPTRTRHKPNNINLDKNFAHARRPIFIFSFAKQQGFEYFQLSYRALLENTQ
jgi:hypothetical protein